MAEGKGIKFNLKGDVPIYTDSVNAISNMKENLVPSTKNALENNVDMKIELKHVLRTSKVRFKLIHVRAHQDDKMPFDELPIDAKLNCLADKYAGGVYTDVTCGFHLDEAPFLNAQVCSLRLPLSRPVTNIAAQVITFSVGHEVETQLARFWKIKKDWLCNVEWKAFRLALKRMRGDNKGQFCKLVHKQIPTMKIMKRNGFSTTSLCPLCLKVEENWQHVFQCKSATALVEKESQMILLKKSLTRIRTHPVLQQRILSMLRQWLNGFSVTVPSNDEEMQMINEAFRDQSNLLYKNLFAGVISHKFLGEMQKQHYQEIPNDRKRLTQNEWNVNFVRALLTFSTNLWKTRCEYLQKQSELSTEQQVRTLALQLRSTLRENPWKIGTEDNHLMKRTGNFFSNVNVKNLNGWIERVLVSMNIHARNEDATRQDIRKWIQLPEHGYRKNVKCRPPTIIKSYKQLTLQESCLNVRTDQPQLQESCLNVRIDQPQLGRNMVDKVRNQTSCPSQEQSSTSTVTWEKIEYDLIRYDEEDGQINLEQNVQEDLCTSEQLKVEIANIEYVQKSTKDRVSNNSLPLAPLGKISEWFVRRLGLYKSTSDQDNSETTEDIIFCEESVGEAMGVTKWCEPSGKSLIGDGNNRVQRNNNNALSLERHMEASRHHTCLAKELEQCKKNDNAGEDSITKNIHCGFISRNQ